MKRMSIFLILAGVVAASSAFSAGTPDQVEPDYTKGKTLARPGRNYHALGPTGAHGYIWALRGPLTRDARMILVKSIDKGTPADGVLRVGDVILGSDGKRFTTDVRKALADAITKAEKKESAGKLVLTIWRNGKEQTAKLTLPVLGSYSDTSPRNCEKTEELIKAACEAIVTRGIGKAGNRVASCVDALGLLATGDKQHWPLVRKYVDTLDKNSRQKGFERQWTWGVAYANLLLTEYYLMSNDETVLPIIKTYANRIAMGRSGVGTWGHTFTDPAQNDGKPFGIEPGYGAMNQIGLTCALSLVLAQKCGVDNPQIATAIRKSTAILSFSVDKGSLAYGGAKAWDKTHENNGVSSQAAVLFDILGNKPAATFYTRMTLASYNERENGHTGHFFNWNWGALGAARAGGEAASSFIRNTRWFTELERRPNGSSVYQFQLANIDHGKYRNWSTTGSRLLQHCLPRKQLYITGKGGGVVEPITGEKLKKVVQAQEITPCNDHDVSELLVLLGHWSPRIRKQAAQELHKRKTDQHPENAPINGYIKPLWVIPKLIAMLDSDNRYARYGACSALRLIGRGSEEAVKALIEKGVKSKSCTMRYFAITAFMANPQWKGKGRLGEGITHERTLAPAIHLAFADLVQAIFTDYPDDPGQWTHALAAQAIFGNTMLRDRGPAGKGLLASNRKAWDAIELDTRIKVMEKLLQHEDGWVRAAVSYHYGNLSDSELSRLMPAIHRAVEVQAAGGTMFGGNARLNGLKVLVKHNIKEGVETGFKWSIIVPGWGNYGRKVQGFPVLANYGAALKHHFPEIQRVIGSMIEGTKKRRKESPKDQRTIKALEEALKKMESTPAPKLVTIKEFQEAMKAKVEKE